MTTCMKKFHSSPRGLPAFSLQIEHSPLIPWRTQIIPETHGRAYVPHPWLLYWSFAYSPWVILSDFGGAFSMGAVGGGIWYGIKGARNSPRVRYISWWLSFCFRWSNQPRRASVLLVQYHLWKHGHLWRGAISVYGVECFQHLIVLWKDSGKKRMHGTPLYLGSWQVAV